MTVAIETTIRKSVSVAVPPEQAFDLFTRRLGEWWPLATHSLAGAGAERAIVEPRVGGRVYEVQRGGGEGEWATVVAWEPPHRLVLEWRVNRDRAATEVEVRFAAEGDGTRVDLEHRGWPVDDDALASYETGWDEVLERYRTHA